MCAQYNSNLHYFKQSCSGGTIQEGEVKGALDVMGIKKPNHEVRELLTGLKNQNKISGGQLTKDQFKEVILTLLCNIFLANHKPYI